MLNYRSLEVWKCSMEVIDLIYVQTSSFPGAEMHGMTSQLRRAAISVSANIAEGLGRRSKKDTSHFLHISRGSLFELDTLVQVSVNQKIMSKETGDEILTKVETCLRILSGLIKRYRDPELR